MIGAPPELVPADFLLQPVALVLDFIGVQLTLYSLPQRALVRISNSCPKIESQAEFLENDSTMVQ